MVRVAPRRLDVDRRARGLRKAREHVLGQAWIVLERELAVRAAPQVDGSSRKRIVHGNDRVAVARDAAPVAERLVERRAERKCGVLGRVMITSLEVAGTLEDQVEARMERELLEKVVVEPGAGSDADTTRAVEREARGEPRLGGCAHHTAEAAYKAVGRALRTAVRAESAGIPSTKGLL